MALVAAQRRLEEMKSADDELQSYKEHIQRLEEEHAAVLNETLNEAERKRVAMIKTLEVCLDDVAEVLGRCRRRFISLNEVETLADLKDNISTIRYHIRMLGDEVRRLRCKSDDDRITITNLFGDVQNLRSKGEKDLNNAKIIAFILSFISFVIGCYLF